MLTYYFVFGVVLRTRFPNDPSRSGFALYFLAGMLPWLAVSEAAGRAPTVMLEHRNFVKKLVFPVETLPLNLTASGLVSELFGVILFVAGVLAAHGSVPASLAWLPVLLIPQILFTAGICWFLAALGVFVRDLAQVNGFLLTLWFFLTPIVYHPSIVPAKYRFALWLNPMYYLVQTFRRPIYEGTLPSLSLVAASAALGLTACLAGWTYFARRADRLAFES